MQLHLFFLFLSLIIFLFILYCLSREDSVLLRKNISLDHIFNLALLEVLCGLFFARLFYVILNFDPFFLNPLVFLLFPYFPGLSLIGALLGGTISIYFLGRLSKTPTERLFDFFSLSFFGAVIGYLFIQILYELILRKVSFIGIIVFLFLLLAFILILRLFRKGGVEEGGVGFLFLVLFSLILLLGNILTNIISKTNGIWLFFGKEDFFLLLIFIISLAVFVKKEKLLLKLKK